MKVIYKKHISEKITEILCASEENGMVIEEILLNAAEMVELSEHIYQNDKHPPTVGTFHGIKIGLDEWTA